MRRIISGATVALCCLTIACGPEEGPVARPDDTTRNLLGQAAEQGGITRIPAGVSVDLPPGGNLDISLLGYNRGDTLAPVRVIEMSDYGCGYCRQFHMETFPVLLEQFIETGKVEWKFMPYVTGMFENSLSALQAAECSLEQSREMFEVLNHRLWDEQAAWKNSSGAAGVVRSWVVESGVDIGRFDSCLVENRRLERIASHTAVARQLGVRGTPTFFVVGYQPLQGALPIELFQQVLDAVYAEATARGAGSSGSQEGGSGH